MEELPTETHIVSFLEIQAFGFQETGGERGDTDQVEVNPSGHHIYDENSKYFLYFKMESTFKHHFNQNYAGKMAGLLITLTKSPGRKGLTQHIDPDKHPVIELSKNKLVRKYVYQWHFI